jgi:ankyrin repeat protein
VTPLFLAAQNGSVRVTEELLEHSPSVDLANTSGQSPLFAAAMNGFLEIFQALLDAGPNVRLKQLEQHWTVLHLSSIHGQVEIVKEIICRYPNDMELIEAGSVYGIRPLLGAAASGQHEIARLC